MTLKFLKLDVDRMDPMLSEPGQPSGYWRARAHIAVASHSREGDKLFLATNCREASDVEYWADMFIKELTEIKRRARTMKWHHEPSAKKR